MVALSQWSKTKYKHLQVERRCCVLCESSPSSYCLKHCFTVWDPVVKWECSSLWFSSSHKSYSLFSSLAVFDIQCYFDFFPHQLLQNACLQATMSEAIIHHTVICEELEDSPPDPALFSWFQLSNNKVFNATNNQINMILFTFHILFPSSRVSCECNVFSTAVPKSCLWMQDHF